MEYIKLGKQFLVKNSNGKIVSKEEIKKVEPVEDVNIKKTIPTKTSNSKTK